MITCYYLSDGKCWLEDKLCTNCAGYTPCETTCEHKHPDIGCMSATIGVRCPLEKEEEPQPPNKTVKLPLHHEMVPELGWVAPTTTRRWHS